MLRLLNYTADVLRYWRDRDYIRMGYGIEARYRRCRKYWDKHLKLCRCFQREMLSGRKFSGCAAVLGAGRLYDIELELLLQKFSRVDLFDADASAVRKWRAYANDNDLQERLGFKIGDLSGSIGAWSDLLEEFLCSTSRPNISALAKFLEKLELRQAPVLDSYTAILSVNLLSQLPLYWRDRAEAMILKNWKLDTDANGHYAPALQNAIEWTMGQLQQQHLDLLGQSNADMLIVVTDTSFMYYTRARAEWEIVPALHMKSDMVLDGYSIAGRNSWLWHIAPQGVEEEEYGIIHQVEALGFRSTTPRETQDG